ncbi:hypothetical protein MMC14_001648 [Varicellaria rhodocarpa]|nr:hypothetical protein [Varicellaria rhodocarpa]
MSSDVTGIAALVIAAVAFVVAIGQLLQQIFGTAEGYQRCQRSVIGRWAEYRGSRWHWREFRYETVFKTPKFVLHPTNSAGNDVILIKGTSDSIEETLVTQWKVDETKVGAAQLVSWLTFLHRLQCLESESPRSKQMQDKYSINKKQYLIDQEKHILNGEPDGETDCAMTSPAIVKCSRSWDFMPPSLIVPFATSTVGDIIALAHRLGMAWDELDLGKGLLRAEGDGQSIVSTPMQGFGILLQFTFNHNFEQTAGRGRHPVLDRTGHIQLGRRHGLTIPCEEADKLGFGIMSGYKALNLPDFFFGIESELGSVRTAMNHLGIDQEKRQRYEEHWNRIQNFLGFSDLLGMVAPFLPPRGSPVTQIMRVHRDADQGPTRWSEGLCIFYKRLTGRHSRSPQMNCILDQYNDMCINSDDIWKKHIPTIPNPAKSHDNADSTLRFLERVRLKWNQTTTYFQDLESQYTDFEYVDLGGAHISQAVDYPALAKNLLEDQSDAAKLEREKLRMDLDPDWGTDLARATGMHLYVERIPLVVQFMKGKGFDNSRVVEDAWWTMIFRAMCWHRCHYCLRGHTRGYGGIPVPSSFYRNPLPVYIV